MAGSHHLTTSARGQRERGDDESSKSSVWRTRECASEKTRRDEMQHERTRTEI